MDSQRIENLFREIYTCERYRTIKLGKRRHAIMICAISSAQRQDVTFDEWKRNTSGYVTERAMIACKRRDMDSAIELFNMAVNAGFVDC